MRPQTKIFSAIIISFIFLILISNLANKAYHNFWKPFHEKLNVLFDQKEKYNVLFLGNSTVNFGINPYYVDSITHLNTYNAGYGGANIETMEMILKAYLVTHPKPESIVISLDYSSFTPNGEMGNYYLFFDYLNNVYINNYLNKKGYNTWLISLLPFLKFSFFDDYSRGSIFKGINGSPFLVNAEIYKGFINNKSNSFQFNLKGSESSSLPDQKNIEIFENVLLFCKMSNIKVVLIFPPRIYFRSKSVDTYITDSIINKLANRFSLTFDRFDTAGLFFNYEFSDAVHLNKEGTKKYSIMIGRLLQKTLQ